MVVDATKSWQAIAGRGQERSAGTAASVTLWRRTGKEAGIISSSQFSAWNGESGRRTPREKLMHRIALLVGVLVMVFGSLSRAEEPVLVRSAKSGPWSAGETWE